MGKIRLLPGSATSLAALCEVMRERHPHALAGVVVAVGEGGVIEIEASCSKVELAYVAVRLLALVNED